MKIAIAKAFNGVHRDFNRNLNRLGAKTFYFDIDRPDWFRVEAKKPGAYIWFADQKEERYREIHDRVWFIENIFRKPVFPDMRMYFSEGDKLKQWQILSYLGVAMPKTYVAAEKNKALAIIGRIKYPFVLKDPYGYGGIHVFKIKNKSEAKKFIDKIFGPGLRTGCSLCRNIFYAQEYIETEADLRVITIGPKAYCAYWRRSSGWKHNLEQGGAVSFDGIPKAALTLCEKISKKMQFHWMGYDLFIPKNKKPLVVEYSANVRVKGALAGGYDVRAAQMKYIYKLLKK